jgi:hypothetical protein
MYLRSAQKARAVKSTEAPEEATYRRQMVKALLTVNSHCPTLFAGLTKPDTSDLSEAFVTSEFTKNFSDKQKTSFVVYEVVAQACKARGLLKGTDASRAVGAMYAEDQHARRLAE